jgi:signal transduction histidine kinase
MVSLHVRTTVAYLAVYVVAVVSGLLSVTDSGLAFFWPAAGVGALWMLRGRTRAHVVLDGALLLVSSTVVDVVMGIPLGASVLFALANLTIGLTVRYASSLVEWRSFWGPLPRRVAGKHDLLTLGLACFVAAVASAPFGLLGAYVYSGSLTWGATAAWLVRNTCSTFVVVAAVLAMLTALMRAHARSGWEARLTSEPRRHWLPELVLASIVTLSATALLFGSERQPPIAFGLIIASTWLGYRFSPAVGGLFALVLSTIAVLCTQAGRGPFGAVADLASRAIVVQVYVLVITVLVLVISLGVAERSALLARVVESEARASSRADLLDAVMDVMTDGLAVVEASGDVLLRNPVAERLAGTRSRPGEPGEAEDHGLFHPDGSPIAVTDLPHARALRGEVVTSEDLLRIDPETGEQLVLSIGAVPLARPEEEGGPLAVLVLHDVTRERTHRRELQAFAGTVAHDLKAPLTGVGSWAEILGDQLDVLGVDVSEPRASLRRIEASAARMDQLISDLLAYSQAQSAVLAPEPLSLTGMVDTVARELRDASSPPLPVFEYAALGRVHADRVLVGQLLTNVIGNAAKYVAPGTAPRVCVTSETVGDMVEVRVSDNGIGIPRAERGRIFDSFYRASSSGSYPGTGLGLAICARAVERHGGRISAREGLDGQGTTLIFTLPADSSAEPEPTQSTEPAEDDETVYA